MVYFCKYIIRFFYMITAKLEYKFFSYSGMTEKYIINSMNKLVPIFKYMLQPRYPLYNSYPCLHRISRFLSIP